MAFFSSHAWAGESGTTTLNTAFVVLFAIAVIGWIFYRLNAGDKTIKNYGYQKSRYDKKGGILLRLVETQDKRVVLSYQLAERSGAHTQCSFCNELLVSEVGELDEYVSQETIDDIHRTVQEYQR